MLLVRGPSFRSGTARRGYAAAVATRAAADGRPPLRNGRGCNPCPELASCHQTRIAYEEDMMKKPTVWVASVVAVLSSMVTTGIWMTIPRASGASAPPPINRIYYGLRESNKITVAPGDVGQAVVDCPANWHAISGGYVIVGFVGLSVPTATEDAIGTSGRDWRVQVADPKTASGDIAFRAEVNCMLSGTEED